MTGLTDFITEARWEDIFTLWYVLVDDAYQELEARFGSWRKRGPKPVFSDSEVITVGLIIDTWFGGDETKGLSFLRQYHLDCFPRLLSNGTLSERRQALHQVIEQVRQQVMAQWSLIASEDRERIVDSAPVEVCSYGRAARNQTLAGPEYVGYHACNNARFFGFRLQASINLDQMVDTWMLAPASFKDGKMLPALLESCHNLTVYGDNAFRDPTVASHLLTSRSIRLWATPRKDSRETWPDAFKQLVRRTRLRIETTFSVLSTVFHISRPGARSLPGLIARVASRLLAYTLCFITAPLFEAGLI